MKNKKLAKFLANALGLALLTTPVTMAFAGCDLSSSNKNAASQLFDSYLLAIREDGDFYSYTDSKSIVAEEMSKDQSEIKSLETNTLDSLTKLCENIGDQYAQNVLIFDKLDSQKNKANSYNKDFSLTYAYINSINKQEMIVVTSDAPYRHFGRLLKNYAESEITTLLANSDNISNLDILKCYISFFDGYLKNAKDYALSNYTRYEDLTDEQVNEIIMALNSSIASTAQSYVNSYERYFNDYKTAVSYDHFGTIIIPTAYLIAGTRSRIETIIQNSIANIYPADFIYFEQPIVNYWQSCIDPLFQEAFGYTWTDCVKLTENPDLHPISWSDYEMYFTLIGMTLDDLPMPTIS